MLRRFLWRYKTLIVILFPLLIFITRVWQPQYLIVPKPLVGFVEYTELSIPLMLLLPISFLLHNRFEIELGLVCGISTNKLIFSKFVPIWLYSIVSHLAVIILYRYKPFSAFDQYRPIIPIFVPDNFKLYLIISAIVTVSFFSSLFLLFRVLSRNMYIAVCLGLFVYIGFQSLNTSISNGIIDIRQALFDPFVSTYFVGNEVPNAISSISVNNLWTLNRIIFLVIASINILLSYLFLRAEKLHHSFGD